MRFIRQAGIPIFRVNILVHGTIPDIERLTLTFGIGVVFAFVLSLAFRVTRLLFVGTSSFFTAQSLILSLLSGFLFAFLFLAFNDSRHFVCRNLKDCSCLRVDS